jgi:hypothetical protein
MTINNYAPAPFSASPEEALLTLRFFFVISVF